MAATVAAEMAALEPSGVVLAGVASRRPDKAAAFAAHHPGCRAFGNYRDLLQDPGIDALYIATPPSEHAEAMLAAIAAGKAVLCEKPFTINADEAARVIDAARRRGVFVMEALWSRFLPAYAALRQMLAAGAIGQPQIIVAGGAFIPEPKQGHYLLDPSLGGGVLLDAGVYLLSLTSMILGEPSRIQASVRMGHSGVDEQNAMILDHAGGAIAVLYVSLRARRSPDMEILGDRGRIRLAAPIFKPTRITRWDQQGVESSSEHPVCGSGYGYQILAVNDALRAGRCESELMSWAETLSIMRSIDSIRRQITVTNTQ
jgi:predicted dehydrogenase